MFASITGPAAGWAFAAVAPIAPTAAPAAASCITSRLLCLSISGSSHAWTSGEHIFLERYIPGNYLSGKI
jgi:hypothetical protein